MEGLSESAIRSRLRRRGYIVKRSHWGGFRGVDAPTDAIVAGESYELTVDHLAQLLRDAEEAEPAWLCRTT